MNELFINVKVDREKTYIDYVFQSSYQLLIKQEAVGPNNVS